MVFAHVHLKGIDMLLQIRSSASSQYWRQHLYLFLHELHLQHIVSDVFCLPLILADLHHVAVGQMWILVDCPFAEVLDGDLWEQ